MLYRLIYYLVHVLHGTIVLIDIDGRFSPSHLNLSLDELKHIHIFRPNKSNLKATLESVENHMLRGEHHSKGREWVGTIVNGGVGGDISVGWRGWLRVERDAGMGMGFGAGVSVQEAVAERERREDQGVQERGWRAVTEIGEFSWK